MQPSTRHTPRVLWILAPAILLAAGRIGLAQTTPGGVNQPSAPGLAGGMSVEQALARALDLVDALEHKTETGSAQSDRVAEASRLASYVLGLDPLNVRAGYVLGRLSLLTGRPRAALSRIEAYVEDPVGASDWYAHKLLGDLYLKSYPKRALTHYKHAASLAPEEPEAIISLAIVNLELSLPREALGFAQKAIQLDAEYNASYRAVLSSTLTGVGDHPAAARAALQAVQITELKIRDRPGDEQMLTEAMGYYELLIECRKALVTAFPEQAQYLVEFLQAYQDYADLDHVIKYHTALRRIATARSNPAFQASPDLLYEEARLSHLVGLDDKAIELLHELLAAAPEHSKAKQLLDAIQSKGG